MKQTFKKISPNVYTLKRHKHLRWLGEHLHITSLWAFNRHTISRAFAVGLFCAFIPLPLQMIIAAIGAIIFSANLPLAVLLVWITNPFTIAPIFYACYQLGALILGISIRQDFVFSLEYLWDILPQIWQPFLLGCLIVSTISALLGYYLVRIIFWVSIANYKRNKRKPS